jgi:hypothetical protein
VPFTAGQKVQVRTRHVSGKVVVQAALVASVVRDDGGESVVLRWPDASGETHEEAIPRKLIRG